MPVEWKLLKNYSKLKKISKPQTLLKLYSHGKWSMDDNEFTLKSKFDYAKKNFISTYGGPNAWTEQLFLYDYTDKYTITITLSALEKGEYQQQQCSDKQYANVIKFIKKNIYKTEDDNLGWLLENHIHILGLLMEYRINNKQSISTFNADLKMFARLFKIALGDTNELYKKYSQLQTDFNRLLIEKETGKNTLNKYEKEKYIEFENLLKIRDELEENWRTELTKNSIKSKSVWELHYKMLLLSSYTLTPCVRTELMIAKFATKEEDMSENIDYVYIPENIEEIVEYNFKICKKGKPVERYKIGYNDESKTKLTSLFRESLLLYKREWVFPLIKNINEKSTISNVNQFLRKLIKGKTLGVNVIRSSYITWRNRNGVSYNDMKEDAIRLRNSVETQMKDYLKKDVIVPTNPTTYTANEIKITDGVDALQKEKEYKKEYYEKNKEKLKQYVIENKNKINALYHINKFIKTGKDPKDSIIKKWKLYKENDKWKSEYVI
jgi:hypothetical protein